MRLFKIALLIYCAITLSCSEETLPNFTDKIEKTEQAGCLPAFSFTKADYTSKDPLIIRINDSITKIELQINSTDSKVIKKTERRVSSFTEYKRKGKTIKIVSDIYVKDLDLTSSKHEIYLLNDCNFLAKMTKFAYRSKRIKAVYYFLITGEKHVGCIVSQHHSLFRRKDKWINISNESLALNWSNRIYHNIIRPRLQ